MVKGKGGQHSLKRSGGARCIAVPAAPLGMGGSWRCRPIRTRSKIVHGRLALFGLTMVLAATAAADDGCPNELKMFERDVRVAREMREPVIWQLAGFNYQRRVSRYCAAEERRGAVNRLKLTDEEIRLLGVGRE